MCREKRGVGGAGARRRTRRKGALQARRREIPIGNLGATSAAVFLHGGWSVSSGRALQKKARASQGWGSRRLRGSPLFGAPRRTTNSISPFPPPREAFKNPAPALFAPVPSLPPKSRFPCLPSLAPSPACKSKPTWPPVGFPVPRLQRCPGFPLPVNSSLTSLLAESGKSPWKGAKGVGVGDGSRSEPLRSPPRLP